MTAKKSRRNGMGSFRRGIGTKNRAAPPPHQRKTPPLLKPSPCRKPPRPLPPPGLCGFPLSRFPVSPIYPILAQAMNLTELLDASARRQPHKTAFVEDTTEVSYATLTEKIDSFTVQLRTLCLPPGARVGLCFPNCVNYVALT